MAVGEKVKASSKAEDKSIIKFFREIKAEGKRITWPTKKDVKKAAIAVVVLCLIYIVYIGGIDFAFQNLFKVLFNI